MKYSYSGVAYERKASTGPTLDKLRFNAAYSAEQVALYQSQSISPPSILDSVVPSIAYVTLPTLFGSDAAAQRVINAAAQYVQASTAPYKSTLLAQLDWLKKDVGQMELINIDGFFTTTGVPEAGKTYTTFLAAQQHLFSRGTIHISTSDPTVYPAITPNYFTAPYDAEVLTAGVSYLRKIGMTRQFASVTVKEAVPGASVFGSALVNYTTSNGLGPEYHAVGTASMLPRSKGGVVDPNLKVYGTKNVRVVDASIIPVHI